jgi:hypothetical protein
MGILCNKGMYASVGTIVGSDFFVKVKRCFVVLFFQNSYAGIVAARLNG